MVFLQVSLPSLACQEMYDIKGYLYLRKNGACMIIVPFPVDLSSPFVGEN